MPGAPPHQWKASPVRRGFVEASSEIPHSVNRTSKSPNKRGHHNETSCDGNSFHHHRHSHARRSVSPSKRGQTTSSSPECHRHHHHHSTNRAFSKEEDDVFKRVLHKGNKSWDTKDRTGQAEAVQDQALLKGVADAYLILRGPDKSSSPLRQQSTTAEGVSNANQGMTSAMKKWNRQLQTSEHAMVRSAYRAALDRDRVMKWWRDVGLNLVECTCRPVTGWPCLLAGLPIHNKRR